MNKSKLETYAPQARKAWYATVTARANRRASRSGEVAPPGANDSFGREQL